MKKFILSPWTALVTLVLCLFVRIEDFSFVESTRLRYFDTLVTSKAVTTSEQVAVVNIDDDTVQVKGQFPFPRKEYSALIADLYARNAGLVVFNVYMPERDRFGGDAALTNTLSKFPVVLPHVATDQPPQTKYPPFRPGVSVIGEGSVGVSYPSIAPNIQSINDGAAGVGIVNVFPEIDGVVRRVPMVINVSDLLYPSISLETLRVAAGDPSFQVKVVDGAIEAVRIPQFGKITTDAVGRIWIDWATKPQQYSATKLPDDFNGKIVIVGITARGINNPVATAVGEVYPHHLQANVIDTVAGGSSISRPDWATGSELAFIVIVSVISLFLITRFTHGYILALVLAGGTYYLSSQLFIRQGYLLDAVFPILAFGLVSFHGYVVKFLVELRQKLQIKKQFGTYLSPALVEKLQKNPELLTLGGDSRELSIMFTDVRGFTTISEHYGADVQGLTKIMNRYMTAMTAKILENNGTLDKYIGDAQMAFWNAPLDEPDHAKKAVQTGLEMLGSLEQFNNEIAAEGVPPFGMGLGINTGVVVVGNMGSAQRFDYTCLGDHVNLASRLEGQSKPYGVKIIVGPETARQVADEYLTLELDKVAVKGKKEGVSIFTVLGKLDDFPGLDHRVSVRHHNKMMQLYRDRNFGAAINEAMQLKFAFGGIMKEYYAIWIDRCKEMIDASLPSDWDGIYRATSK